jgi:tRNA threonylcarbamoyl adenosine modification protein YeaZ
LILVIDTSSAISAIALLRPGGGVIAEQTGASGQAFDVPARTRELRQGARLSRIAVATGPGSFTGLRVGVSFGLGLAVGLRIPIVPLSTLAIQAARARAPVTALSEAGRGRVYHQAPGHDPGLAEPREVPTEWAAAGWLRPATRDAIAAAGVRFMAESELRTFGEAAAIVLETAREVAYDSLRLEYMQSFASKF